LAAAFIVSLLVPGGLSGRNSRQQVATTLNTGGPVEIQPDQGRGHIPLGEANADYLTHPATSGGHWDITGPNELAPFGAPVRWGNYELEIADEALVHNLEHGGIGLHYNCPDGCDETVQQLLDMTPRGFSQFVISPYSNMDSKIALTAWRHIQYLDEFDEAAVRTFINEYLARAPENNPGNSF
jgi:hypothetical protein